MARARRPEEEDLARRQRVQVGVVLHTSASRRNRAFLVARSQCQGRLRSPLTLAHHDGRLGCDGGQPQETQCIQPRRQPPARGKSGASASDPSEFRCLAITLRTTCPACVRLTVSTTNPHFYRSTYCGIAGPVGEFRALPPSMIASTGSPSPPRFEAAHFEAAHGATVPSPANALGTSTSGLRDVGNSRLLQLLVRAGLVTLEAAPAKSAAQAQAVVVSLIQAGVVSEEQVVDLLRRESGIAAWEPSPEAIPKEIASLVSAALARKHFLMPVRLSASQLTVAMVDPTDMAVIHELKFITRYDIRPLPGRLSDIRSALDKYYPPGPSVPTTGSSTPEPQAIPTDLGNGADAPVIRLVQAILSEAIQANASDVHIEPSAEAVRVRYRCDGVLREVLRPPHQLKNAIGSRIKILGDLDIAERRLPQDGRLKLTLAPGEAVDVRISVLPTLHGEKTVLRILDQRRARLGLESLGLDPPQLDLVRQALQRPHGLILVTGPTGSGKSTSLYAALEELNRESRNILTAEDPVEVEIPGINQVPINEDIGLTFATALRAFLRQDPDVIMVGEIRDGDTAAIAVKAALTGHLVLSTLHTNDTVASITRLVNMGVEPYLIAASLDLVVAQRLVRRTCRQCTIPDILTQEARAPSLTDKPATAAHNTRGRGCPQCNGTGYRGRLAIYEVLAASDSLRQLILRSASEEELRSMAHAQGSSSLRDSGLRRVSEGVTSMEEILSATLR